MPFDPIFRRAFTPPSIRSYAPHSPGIYGITNAREWVYIGVAPDIQEALLGHLQGSIAAVLARLPTGFVFEVCEPERFRERQDRLVMEYEPSCNRLSF